MDQLDVLGDLEPLPDGWTPLEVAAVVKCLDENGDVALSTRSTKGIAAWEAVGMLQFAAKCYLDDLTADSICLDDDEDE